MAIQHCFFSSFYENAWVALCFILKIILLVTLTIYIDNYGYLFDFLLTHAFFQLPFSGGFLGEGGLPSGYAFGINHYWHLAGDLQGVVENLF